MRKFSRAPISEASLETPAIEEHDLVTLEDPEEMVAAQYVVPIIRTNTLNDQAVETLNEVTASLTTESLMEMNALNSGGEAQEPTQIAADWLEENELN